jgi:hypothetical protein
MMLAAHPSDHLGHPPEGNLPGKLADEGQPKELLTVPDRSGHRANGITSSR